MYFFVLFYGRLCWVSSDPGCATTVRALDLSAADIEPVCADTSPLDSGGAINKAFIPSHPKKKKKTYQRYNIITELRIQTALTV